MNNGTAKRISKKIVTHKIDMPNGLKILVREDHSQPSISMTAYFLGGKRTENKDNAGITALGQRLMLKGAGEYNAKAIAEELEFYGIHITPFHGVDVAGIKMKSLSRHFDRGLDMFARIICEPTFALDEFDKEKENLLEDIRKEKDSPLFYCNQLNESMVFEGHPYELPSRGTIESVTSITRQDVAEHHRAIYSPCRMVIAFVGDIRTEEAEEKISRHFSRFDAPCAILPDPGDIKGPIKNVKEKIELSDKLQAAITVGYHAPPMTDEDFYTFRILNQVLSGMGSRLFIELRDKQGLAYNVNSSYSGLLNGGIFQAYILTGYNTKDKARMSLLEEVDRLRTRLVTYDELVRAKRYHLGLFDIELQSKSSIASRLAYYELVGLGHDFIDNYSERIKRITRQKVKRAAEKFLKPQSYAITLLNPASFPKNLQ
jgi:zinc protease